MNITYDAKSFLLDGRRIWIVAGEVHYFRHPRAEWRQALLRAKRAGLNTISTYVPWNFHEMKEGQADFTGDRDLAAYIDLIGELGMYAMIRPGPYICSEWDGGGIPAWLCAKPVKRFREDDPVYMSAVKRWFDRLLPIISERQVTKGGPVITIQNENEYPGGYDASMRRYIAKINEMFREHGIAVPILACNVHGASRTNIKINNTTEKQDQILDAGMILTYNHHMVVEPLRELREVQPNAPLVVSEFWSGHPVYWGIRIRNYPNDEQQARAAYEYTSLGAQMVYYMFDGGNNFAEMLLPVSRRKVMQRRIAGISVFVADEEMARRCWLMEDAIIFGPDYVEEKDDEGAYRVKIGESAPEILYVDERGQLAGKPVSYEETVPPLPELGDWKMHVCEEMSPERKEGWIALDRPRSHEELGEELGYVWYRAEFQSDKDGVEKLLIPHAPNRISVFVNGEFCGVHAERRSVRMRDDYAHPADWAFEELTVRLKKGINRLVFLSDNLGHNYDVPIPVGIQGPVYIGSRRIDAEPFREVPPMPVSEDAFHFLYHREYRTPKPLPALEFDLSLAPDERAILVLHGVKAWVTADGEEVLPMSYPESPWTMFSEIKRWIAWQLPERAAGRTCKVRVQYIGNSPQMVKEHLTVYKVPAHGECKNWHWKRWELPDLAGADASGTAGRAENAKEQIEVWLPVGSRVLRKGRLLKPAWLEARFSLPEGERPVFLRIGELQKGQIFLNGRNVSRFWNRNGTQELYYLPRSWMREENRLVIFEELGLPPQNVALVYGDSGRWKEVKLELKTA